ncbi:hypothetical protein Y032_0069g301 [Ancylostoma ceylanicum]|uniref:Uncharacterized protein n=1 Tax=Ancylostoma ceylanicum TaxID=53326 RepID=A0A016TX41_9BILA|nr:hypothetical protein Y032_0069g301 [Ancylostoma ceylanicum]
MRTVLVFSPKYLKEMVLYIELVLVLLSLSLHRSVCKSLSAIRTRLLERFNFSFLKWSSQLVGCHGCGIRFFQRQSVNQQAEAEKKHVFTKEENTDEPQSHNE